MQVCAIQTKARWAQKLPWDINDPGDLDAANMKKMVDYGDAEAVLQRRLMVVTDDYMLMLDYLKGDREHTYDWLIHPVGYIETNATQQKMTGHSERISNDPNSSYHYITDCKWSQVSGSVLNRFKDGNVYFDIRTVLQEPMEMAVGTYPSAKPLAEEAKRKTLLFRSEGKAFRFAALLEPYLDESVVQDFTMDEPGTARVQLKDGRTQVIEVQQFETTGKATVRFKEYQDGQLLRQEESKDE
jgi:hypothetical protein